MLAPKFRGLYKRNQAIALGPVSKGMIKFHWLKGFFQLLHYNETNKTNQLTKFHTPLQTKIIIGKGHNKLKNQ